MRLSDVDWLRSKSQFTAVNLALLTQHIAESFQESAQEKKLKLIIDLPPDLPLISGDEKQLAEVLRHLLSNALNYTQQGEIRVDAFSDENVCVEVSDTGIGIPAEDLPHVFERFYRGQEVSQLTFPGAGLGLFIVQEIVALHGGRVSLSSSRHEGTTIRICFPIA